MTRSLLATLNVILLIHNAIGLYLIWFGLDSSQPITGQMTELRVGVFLLFAFHGFMYGLVTPPFTTFLLEGAEAKRLWDYTEDGIHQAWYAVCLGIGVAVFCLLGLELWPVYIAPVVSSAEQPTMPNFGEAALWLGIGCMFMRMSQVPPNPILGYRLPFALKDPAVWQRVHQLSERWVAIPAILIGIAMLFLPAPRELLVLFSAIAITILIWVPVAVYYQTKDQA